MGSLRAHGEESEPGEDAPLRDGSSSSVDVLSAAASALTGIEASPAARAVLSQVLGATLLAFTRTRSVRDPLPDTAAESAEEALAVLAGIDQLRSSLAAMDAAWQVAAEQRIRRSDARRGVPTVRQGKGASSEIALARRISPAASAFSLASARRLVQHMPGTVDALWEGAMTESQASTVAGALSTASPETCRRIDEILRDAPHTLHGTGRRRLRSDIERIVQHLEPETSRERADRAARQRHVTLTPLADGMARVTAMLRGIDAVALIRALRAEASSRRAAGARAPEAALEADALLDAVLTRSGAGEPAPVAASGTETPDQAPPRRPASRTGIDVGIVITDTALLGPEDDSVTALLEGYGNIPAHVVRDTLLGRPPGHLRHDEAEHPDEQVTAFYRRLYASPSTGDLVAMESRSRAFPAGLARMIRWRDTTCRTPWCNAMIRQSDHVVPHHRGGPTSLANGQGLCVRCNLLKEHGLWVLAPLSRTAATGSHTAAAVDDAPSSRTPAAWFWTSPHGAQGISWTPPAIRPADGADPSRPDHPPDHDLSGHDLSDHGPPDHDLSDHGPPDHSPPPPAPPA